MGHGARRGALRGRHVEVGAGAAMVLLRVWLASGVMPLKIASACTEVGGGCLWWNDWNDCCAGKYCRQNDTW